MSGPRVLFVLPHPVEGPSSRFRVYQFLPYLQAHGVEAVVRPLLDSRRAALVYEPGRLPAKVSLTLAAAWDRMRDVARASRFDVAYVLREAFPFGPPVIERALRRRVGRLIFDFDDAIYHRSLAYANPLDRLRDFSKVGATIALADHVVVGSRHLRDYALGFTTPESVTVLPTVVDTQRFTPGPPRPPGGPITVGWIGTPRGSGYLEALRGAMVRVVARHGHVRFVFVGAAPFDPQGLPITFRPWRLADEIDDIRGFDIGIMPLSDDEETRGKCGFKLIEYMSLGIPTVSSPVGANREICVAGLTGLFARTQDEWVEALCRLADDPALRARLAAGGRQRSVAEFSLASVAPRLLCILRGDSVPASGTRPQAAL